MGVALRSEKPPITFWPRTAEMINVCSKFFFTDFNKNRHKCYLPLKFIREYIDNKCSHQPTCYRRPFLSNLHLMQILHILKKNGPDISIPRSPSLSTIYRANHKGPCLSAPALENVPLFALSDCAIGCRMSLSPLLLPLFSLPSFRFHQLRLHETEPCNPWCAIIPQSVVLILWVM